MRERWAARLPHLWVLVGAFLALGPALLGRGYVLVGDMTFVPCQPWSLDWLGLGDVPPRAVPADALVSALSQVLPGEVIQKVVLAAVFCVGGWGVLRLLSGLAPAARVGAALLYVWNPFVYERLAIGHWGLLLGLAALPWVVHAAQSVRRGRPGALSTLWLWLAVAAFSSPTGGLVAGAVAVTLAAGRGEWRRNAVVGGSVLLVNLPWIVPGVLEHAGTSDPTGARAFAARADTPLGALGSLAGLGGIWKASVVPGERATLVLSCLALLLTAVAVACLWRAGPGSADGRLVGSRRLVVVGLVALVIAWFPTTAVGAELMEQAIAHVPGAGLLRDSQKWVSPLVLVVALGFGIALDRVSTRLRSVDPALSWVAVVLAALPLLLLPSQLWGQWGGLRPVTYPREWHAVADELERAGGGGGRLVVLPWSAYVRYLWNEDRAALDPTIRFFPAQVVTSDDLVLGRGQVVRGDDARARAIGDAVREQRPLLPVLRREGVRWVLVEKGVPSAGPVLAPPGTVLHDGATLTLIDVGGSAEVRRPAATPVVLGVDAAVLLITLAAGASLGRRKRLRIR